MAILLVGADRLGSITDILREQGVAEVIHWTGRDKKQESRLIPQRVREIVVFCDFVNHNLAKQIKQQAKKKNIPVVYTKRSLSCFDTSCLQCSLNCPLNKNKEKY